MAVLEIEEKDEIMKELGEELAKDFIKKHIKFFLYLKELNNPYWFLFYLTKSDILPYTIKTKMFDEFITGLNKP